MEQQTRAKVGRVTQGFGDQGAVGAGDGEGVAVEGRGPAGLVDDVMVVVAERDEVVERGGAAVFPVGDVVGDGPTVGSGASGVAAAVVADCQCSSDLGWDRAPGSSDVE